MKLNLLDLISTIIKNNS